MAKTRRGVKRGGGYSFAGGLFGNNTTDGRGGNPGWSNDTGKDCGAVAGRGGNDMMGGRRRRRRGGMVPDPPPSHGGRRTRRRRHRGGADNASLTLNRGQGGGRRRTRRRGGNRGGNGNPDLAQQVPRANYSFQGSGERGIPNYAPDTY